MLENGLLNRSRMQGTDPGEGVSVIRQAPSPECCTAGYASSIGIFWAISGPSWLSPFQKCTAIVRVLRDAGAYPLVKTDVPITLFSFESSPNIRGRHPGPLRLVAPNWASGQFVSRLITTASTLPKHLRSAFRRRVGLALPWSRSDKRASRRSILP